MLFSAGSRVRTDFKSLCARITQRLYPETIPALAMFWLKTLWNQGYTRDDWSILDQLLKHRLASETEPEIRQVFSDLRTWIRDARAQDDQPGPGYGHSTLASQRPPLDNRDTRSYVVRLVNEWMPVEVAGSYCRPGYCGPGIFGRIR